MARSSFLPPDDIAASADWGHIRSSVFKTDLSSRLKDSLTLPDMILEDLLEDGARVVVGNSRWAKAPFIYTRESPSRMALMASITSVTG